MQTYEIVGLIFGCIVGIACFLISLRPLAILQQLGYREKNFLKWYFSKGNINRRRISLFATALLLLVALFCVGFCYLDPVYANLLSLIPVVGVTALYLYAEKRRALKVPARCTPRLIRLGVVECILSIVLCAAAGYGLAKLTTLLNYPVFELLRFVPLTLLTLFCPLIEVLGSLISKIFEIPHNRAFVRRAKKVLQKKNCIKVGITGSFAKTSVKNFAAHMLSCKYKVLCTPASYNTPMGIARTILKNEGDYDIFLAEMGARHVGDIEELCALVDPTVGVVTGVCEQHIETFKSLDNIRAEKGKLAGWVKKCVLGKTVADLPCAGEALKEGVDFSLEDIHLTTEGGSFTLKMQGESVQIEVPLLGRCALEDVALSAALCKMLGLSLEEIKEAAKTLRAVPHRLQSLQNNGIFILDDAYNSNIEGAKNALETLSLFEGEKFVVTPGLVELGELKKEINARLGALLVGFNVILVGETLVLPLRRGFIEAGGSEEKIAIVPTLKEAQNILAQKLKAGDAVLFLNDLPDCYR